MLLAAALAIDLAMRWRWHSLLAVGLLLAAFYGSAALVGQLTLMPQFAPVTALFVALPLWGMVVAAGECRR